MTSAPGSEDRERGYDAATIAVDRAGAGIPTDPKGRPGFCAYCGLPTPGGGGVVADGDVDGGAPGEGDGEGAGGVEEFCCQGCRWAAEITRARGAEGARRWALARLGTAIFFTLNVMVFTMALWADDFVEAGGETHRTIADVYRYLCLLLSLPVFLLLAPPIAENAVEELGRGRLSTDSLLTLGVVASWLVSTRSVFAGEGHVYFEVGCVILVMVTLGRWLDATGRWRATNALEALEKLLPERARRVDGEGVEEEVASSELRAGDRVRVLPGERFPTDGRIVSGSALVDERVLTGESRAAERGPGDAVLGGTCDLDGELVVECASEAGGGAFGRLLAIVREARSRKSKYQRLADRVSARFVPWVLGLGLAAFAFHGYREGWERGLMVGLSVVLIACPCALGVATPLAIWTALGTAARRGIVFRDGEALERLAELRALRFDKTGTLTTGAPRVSEFRVEPGVEEELARRVGRRLAGASDHAMSRAAREWLGGETTRNGSRAGSSEVRQLPGMGVTGDFADWGIGEAGLGNARLMARMGCATPEAYVEWERAGDSVALLCWGGAVRGGFRIEEELRGNAREVLDWFRGEGFDLGILTGDNKARARAVGEALGVDARGGLLPEEKAGAIEEARRIAGPTGMVGDGVNDAPALAVSDLGIAMGTGADVARDSARVCLIGDDLAGLVRARRLATRTVGIVRGNLFWAFGYNVVGVGVAVCGWLNPAFAAFLMVASSLMVVLNSSRLGESGREASARFDSDRGVRESESRFAGAAS